MPPIENLEFVVPRPLVSFVVPCYGLAHLLSKCVNSILRQTYLNLEILIMDDCSPDNTAEIAKSFADARVQHVRNETNLGHLRNYNKGISLARGNYVWLISADDCLRRDYAVERYVDFMQHNPSVGYVFCPATALIGGEEAGLLRYSFHGDKDKIFLRQEFFSRLLNSNSVPAASGMVRREAYERFGAFPLGMPFAGDWYLWLLFALHYDVAYLSESMVLYRQHEVSMTNQLRGLDPRICGRDDLRVLWEIKLRAEEANREDLANQVESSLVDRAALLLTSRDPLDSRTFLTIEDFEESVNANSKHEAGGRSMCSRVYARAADRLFWERDFHHAATLYNRSLFNNPWSAKIRLQSLLMSIGPLGILMRECQYYVRRKITSVGKYLRTTN